MKKLYILVVFLLSTISYLSAQTQIVTGLAIPSRIFVDGDKMYITNSYDGATNLGTVVVADLSGSLPTTATTLITGLTYPYGLYVDGDDLFVCDENNIYKKSIAAGLEDVADLTVVTAVTEGSDLAYHNGYLYYSEYSDWQVSRIDITAENAISGEIVVDNINEALGITFGSGNTLYVSSYIENAIYKIDITGYTSGNPILADVSDIIAGDTGLYNFDGIYLNNDELYIATSDGVATMTVTNPPTVPIVEYDGPNSFPAASDVELVGNNLYVADIDNNTITQFIISTAGVKDYVALGLNMYPNPTSEYINIDGLTSAQSYIISNVLGENVQSGEIAPNENINVKTLKSGVYFVKLANGVTLKFLKE